MFRRSNSSSNIPLPKTNLFGSKDSRTSKVGKRSQSTSRLSQRDSVTSLSQLRPQSKSSLDRKSSTVGLLKTTPLHRIGGRSGSLQRTTPSSAISQRTNSSRGTTPSSCRKDHITIQKLASDKKWVADQYMKVQNFIMSSDLFDLGVVNANNIKPPSINNFIYVTGIMLMEIFPRVKISKENYKEVIPAQLKVLKYPGTLTNSVLKTVNTMHSWPQVIGMWSWLIDKVNFCNGLNDLSLVDHLEHELKMKFLVEQNLMDFMIKRYKIFNHNDEADCAEEIDKANDGYVKTLAELLDVDFNGFQQLQDDVVRKNEYRNKQEAEIDNLEEENKKLESEIQQMSREIEDFKENDPIEENDIENELQQFQSNLKELRESTECIKENITRLREAIRVQPCTHQEKLTLLRQTDELRNEIEVKRKKIEHAREIKNRFDHILTTEISKIQTLVIKWNRSLMEVSIKKPHLKHLLLREKGFHDPCFLSELEEMSTYNVTVEREMTEALAKVNEDLRVAEQKKHEILREIEELDEIVRRINEECAAVCEKIADVAKETKKVVKDLEVEKISHTEQMKELKEKDVLEVQAKTIEELKSKKELLDVEVKKFGVKMLSFFVEMHNQVVNNLKEMEGIKAKLAEKVEARQKVIVEKQCHVLEVLKSFNS